MKKIPTSQFFFEHHILEETRYFIFGSQPIEFKHSQPSITHTKLLTLVVKDTIDWIEINISNKFNSKLVAEKSGYSRCYFQREFKQITGFSLKKYITIRRVIAVSKALHESNTPLRDLVEKFGFTNELSLYRAFNKFLHMPPATFRDMHKN